VDLRGHGRSDKPEGSYAMGVFADDLAWVCEQIGLEKPVVIGHSMGGIVAFDLAARYPDLPSAVIMLDAAIVLPSASRGAIPAFLKTMQGSDYREVVRRYVENNLFIPTDDADRKENILSPELRIMLEPFVTAHCLHSTPNATANATLDLVLALAGNRASVVGAQVSLEGEVFGLDTVVGVPVLVDTLGWSGVECPPLTGEEQERLQEVTATIRANLAEWSGITPED
jgi:pimeloyl-ACP methyl ester carboxylesterase